MSDMAALERRYRRMLIWFPADHRRIYEEEMIGVLLASASDDENRAGLADMTNIALWGLRTRLRGWVRAGRVDPQWGDALAAFAVVAPLLMIAFLTNQLYEVVRFERFARFSRFARVMPIQFDYAKTLTALLLMLAATIATVAALAIGPTLVRRRQALAVTLTAAVPVLLGALAVVYFDLISPTFNDIPVGFTAFFIVELLAVVLAPDPGRGWRVLGRSGLIIASAAAVLTVAAERLLQGALNSLSFNRTAAEVAILALGIALFMIFGSAAQKRMLALLLIPGYPLLIYVQFYSFMLGGNVNLQVLYLPTLAIALLVGLAIWHASRHPAPQG